MDKIQEQWPEWQTVEIVGEGTFGTVYKAQKEVYGNISYAAIKVIEIPKNSQEIRDLQQSDMNEASIKKFYVDMIHNLMSEIQIMESMKSANGIVGIEDYKVVQRGPMKWEVFIRMEFLEDMQSYLGRHPMTGREVVGLGIDLCEALKNCEMAGIIHRDVKIDNVFINRFGSFKLGDFGIAKQLGKSRAAVSQKGTNMYMAPEIFRGEPYDARVDIYSLGILLYRLLNKGRFPFMPLWPASIKYSDNENAMQQRISGKKKIPAIPDIPQGLSDIVCKACAYDKENRYQNADDLAKDLKKYINSEELTQIVTIGRSLKAEEIERYLNKSTLSEEIGSEQSKHNEKMPEFGTAYTNTLEDEKTYAAFGETGFTETDSFREKTNYHVAEDYSDERTYAAFESERSDDTHNNVMPDMPMKWYKFVTYVQLPFSMVFCLYKFYSYVSGSVYGSAEIARNVYTSAPALRGINYYYAVVNLFTILGTLFVITWMGKLKTKAWKYYIYLLIINGGATVVFTVMYMNVIRSNSNFDASSIVQYVINISYNIFVTVLMGAINYIYFKKRDHLFVN